MENSSLPPISSTQGSTLVQVATVVAVRPLARPEPAAPGRAIPGDLPPGQPPSSSLQEITVQFQDGRIRRYHIDSQEEWRVGEQVQVSESRGQVRLSH